jgi:hypothetical protein
VAKVEEDRRLGNTKRVRRVVLAGRPIPSAQAAGSVLSLWKHRQLATIINGINESETIQMLSQSLQCDVTQIVVENNGFV